MQNTYLIIVLQTTPQKEKGRINLADVRAVEEVDSEALGNKPNALQVRDPQLHNQTGMASDTYLYL